MNDIANIGALAFAARQAIINLANAAQEDGAAKLAIAAKEAFTVALNASDQRDGLFLLYFDELFFAALESSDDKLRPLAQRIAEDRARAENDMILQRGVAESAARDLFAAAMEIPALRALAQTAAEAQTRLDNARSMELKLAEVKAAS